MSARTLLGGSATLGITRALARLLIPRSVRTLLTRRRGLPALRVFARVMLPRTRREEPPSTERVLAAQVRRLPADAVIVQRAPADTAATLALARACWGSARRVHVEWPGDAQTADESRKTFSDWNRRVIKAELLPFVRVDRDVEPLLHRAALVYPDSGGVR